MAFGIRFDAPTEPHADGIHGGRQGRILLGSYWETFESYIGFWSPLDYETHWARALDRLVRDQRESACITSIADPETAEVVFWWVFYPTETGVVAQEQLLPLRSLVTPFRSDEPWHSIPVRRSHTDDGAPVSEWFVAWSEVRRGLTGAVMD
jgi:hypothetical protein